MADQRHHPGMFDLFVQFIQEVVRALLVDELSGRVRRLVVRRRGSRRNQSCRRVLLEIQRRNGRRLLNRLLTEIKEEL
jgi:hypothetical protein